MIKTKPLNFIVMLCFLCSLSALAQQPEYYINGQIKAEGKYKKDQKTGDWTYFNENGTVSLKESYDRRYPNIKMATYFHPNGKIKTSGKLINNQKYEDWTWYREDGTTEVFGNYTADRVNGPLTYYNTNGNKERKGGFKNNVKQGEWEYYYNSGEIYKKGTYKDGKEVGEWDVFDGDGTYESTEVYPDEYEQIQFYDPMKSTYNFPSNTYNSTPFIKTYSNGKNEVVGQTKGYNKIGEWKWYYENGTLKEEGSFDEQSYQTGIWKTYFPNGVLRSEEKKDKGYSSDLVKYHTNGKVRFKKTDSGTYTEYYTTGEIYTVEKKILGVSTGVSYYNKSGKLLKTL